MSLFKKSKLKTIYPRYSKDKEHYYYFDNNNIDWCFYNDFIIFLKIKKLSKLFYVRELS